MSEVVLTVWTPTPPELDAEVKVIVDGHETVFRVNAIERLRDHPHHYDRLFGTVR